nr:transposase, mutator type [Tanacetum cinerariifolium]
MGHMTSTRGVFMSFVFGLPSLCVCDEEKSFCDSGIDSEYEGERKKALKMYHKINKDNASNAESGGTTWKENFYVGLKFSNSKEISQAILKQ